MACYSVYMSPGVCRVHLRGTGSLGYPHTPHNVPNLGSNLYRLRSSSGSKADARLSRLTRTCAPETQTEQLLELARAVILVPVSSSGSKNSRTEKHLPIAVMHHPVTYGKFGSMRAAGADGGTRQASRGGALSECGSTSSMGAVCVI